MGFHPGYEQDTCPICGAKLVVKEFMGYGINSGYFSECPNCHLYDDIWACGIRELTVGDWKSESFLSDYGTPTKDEAKIEKRNLRMMRHKIWQEKLKRIFKK